ncbi:hypothetical protein [Metallosphaera hakonensis]|uniref:hypothetical protein n=1 Tax=Metallosphaera hakonensis TaxID=79601 RepID=UPI0006D25736|nr:hypothetical protein [Metallosphaera hakonensis]
MTNVIFLPSIQIDDPDVEVITRDERVDVYVDLRTLETREDDLALRADISAVYIYDKSRRAVIKIVKLPVQVKSYPLTFHLRNGTLIINLQRL